VSPQHFRATLQGDTCLQAWSVTHYFLLSLTVALPAIFSALNHRLRGEAFLQIVHGGLVCVGFVLIQAIRHR
jgi:lipopolysaccharide export LptBFGC system permease protein LptF